MPRPHEYQATITRKDTDALVQQILHDIATENFFTIPRPYRTIAFRILIAALDAEMLTDDQLVPLHNFRQ